MKNKIYFDPIVDRFFTKGRVVAVVIVSVVMMFLGNISPALLHNVIVCVIVGIVIVQYCGFVYNVPGIVFCFIVTLLTSLIFTENTFLGHIIFVIVLEALYYYACDFEIENFQSPLSCMINYVSYKLSSRIVSRVWKRDNTRECPSCKKDEAVYMEEGNSRKLFGDEIDMRWSEESCRCDYLYKRRIRYKNIFSLDDFEKNIKIRRKDYKED